MSGIFLDEEAYDVVGSTVGAVDRAKKILPDKGSMKVGDVLLGLTSNGCHSNGFSLIRKIIDRAGLSYYDKAPWGSGEPVGESVLAPTRIYVKQLLRAVAKDLIKGMSHITGGGLIENVPRMLPKHLAAEMDVTGWEVPKVLAWFKHQGQMDNMEFARTFNTGLGMVMVVAQEKVEETMDELRKAGETVRIVGKVGPREGQGEGCVLQNLESWG